MPFDLAKQFQFALAKTLTAVAIEARDASIAEIKGTFTIRNTWVNPGSAVGIKALPASKLDLESAVATRADWLIAHEVEGEKKPRGKNLAVPTSNVRRTKRQIIQKTQRPKNLRGAIVIKTDSGPILFQRTGKGAASRLLPLYRLIRRARLKKTHVFFDPISKTVGKRFDPIFYAQLRRAIATAKR